MNGSPLLMAGQAADTGFDVAAFFAGETGERIVATLLIIVIVWIGRGMITARVRRNERFDTEERLRLIVTTRNAALLLILAGVVIVWFQQIQTFAASVVVIAAAIVLATKELILCLSGSVLRATSKSFDVGDRIEIMGLRGDVIDRTALATTILEIGPGQTSHQHTGRAITMPNSLFLANPVINETFTEDYVLHAFTVPLVAGEDWRRAEKLLLGIADDVCAPILNDAREHMQALSHRHATEPPNVEPRVSIQLPEPGRVTLLARIPCPARKKGRMEQTILRRFLADFRTPLPVAEEKKDHPRETD